MSSLTYEVRARPPLAVKEDLLRLWRQNLSPGTTPEARFQWLYEDAPRPADTVHMLEAVVGGQTTVVGTNGLVRRAFWVADREVCAAVSCDLAVDRQHRALGPALTLVRALRADVGSKFDLIYGFPNSKAEGVLKRAGFREVGRAQRRAKVLRFSGYVDRLAQRQELPALLRLLAARPLVARSGAAIVDAVRGVALQLALTRLSRQFEIRTERTPDARWDDLWISARREYRLVGDRSAAYVRWRFKTVPDTIYVTLQRRGEAKLEAYAVMQLDPKTGAAHIRDVFGHRVALGPLLDALVPLAWRAGALSLSVRFLGAADVERHLAARGFVLRDDTRCIVADASPALADHVDLLGDASRWHLFDVDEES